ncbi:MAG: low temperature requirement protein A [Acidimicrobiales bacterium]
MPSVRLVATMSSRDPEEPHRAATPLALFFDLTFVVAVAEASSTIHHQLVSGHASDAFVAYPMVFFAIWGAWMHFTWFASAYDPDDAAYRVAVLVQMAGVLVFAAGVPRFLEELDPGVAVLGYVVMRVGLVGQWLRAAVQHPEGRACSLRYAAGITACQVGWILLLVAPDGLWIPGFVVLGALELAVPAWAEHRNRTTWNPRHIGERYGLFTIIVLGESVLSATVAMHRALDAGGALSELVTTALGGFLVVSAMWWVYFDQPVDRVLDRARHAFTERGGWQSFIWGYGHYVVFASAAAVGVGLAVAVDQTTGRSLLTDAQAALVLTAPVALYLVAVWLLHRAYKERGPLRNWACLVTATLVLASTWSGEPVLLTGLAMVGLVLVALIVHHRRRVPPPTRDDTAEVEAPPPPSLAPLG